MVAENQWLFDRWLRTLGARCGLRDQMMVGREIAHGIGIGSITREHVRLAAAAAEVLVLFWAAAAGLAHPGVAAEVIETV